MKFDFIVPSSAHTTCSPFLNAIQHFLKDGNRAIFGLLATQHKKTQNMFLAS
jgi:hypothetical protein